MESGDLFNYYNISECTNHDVVFKKLNELKEDGRLEFYNESADTILIEDIDLSEADIEEISQLFEEYDVIPDIDKSEGNDNDDYDDFNSNFYDEDDDY